MSVHRHFLYIKKNIGENSTMKKTNYLEIIGILSLSLLLLSTYAVSSCLPEMMKTYHQYDQASVDILISVPSASIMAMIVLSPILSKFLSERVLIVAGLLLFSISGITPVFVTSYPVVLASRITMGIGTGMVNAKAVSLIGERFSGNLRSRLQGIRCSMETLGQSALMLVVAQILPHGWNYAFMIYGAGFIILLMYLAFVPKNNPAAEAVVEETKIKTAEKKKSSLTAREYKILFSNLALGFALVSASSLFNMRLTNYVVESGVGTASNGSTILSISIFSGFLAGLIFGKMLEKMRRFVLPLTMFAISLGMCMMGLSQSLTLITVCACLCNFFVTIGTSYMFNAVSEQMPLDAISTGSAFALIGCNLGASSISLVLKAITFIGTDKSTSFFCYAVVYLVLAIGVTAKAFLSKRK